MDGDSGRVEREKRAKMVHVGTWERRQRVVLLVVARVAPWSCGRRRVLIGRPCAPQTAVRNPLCTPSPPTNPPLLPPNNTKTKGSVHSAHFNESKRNRNTKQNKNKRFRGGGAAKLRCPSLGLVPLFFFRMDCVTFTLFRSLSATLQLLFFNPPAPPPPPPTRFGTGCSQRRRERERERRYVEQQRQQQ